MIRVIRVISTWVVIVGIILCPIIGYVLNINKVYSSDYTEFSGLEIIRIVGIIIPPVGVVTGYIPLEIGGEKR